MARKVKEVPVIPEKKKITVIFEGFSMEENRAVEFEGDNFALINSENDHPVYVITNEGEDPSNIFVSFESVLVIGYTKDILPMIEAVSKKKK